MAERGIALKVESEDSMMIRAMDGESIDVSRSSEDIIDRGRMAENPNSAMFRTVVLDTHPFEQILSRTCL